MDRFMTTTRWIFNHTQLMSPAKFLIRFVHFLLSLVQMRELPLWACMQEKPHTAAPCTTNAHIDPPPSGSKRQRATLWVRFTLTCSFASLLHLWHICTVALSITVENVSMKNINVKIRCVNGRLMKPEMFPASKKKGFRIWYLGLELQWWMTQQHSEKLVVIKVKHSRVTAVL